MKTKKKFHIGINNKELLQLLTVIVIGLSVFWGFRILDANIGGPFNFFKYVMNPKYFEQHSKDLAKHFEKLDDLNTEIYYNDSKIQILQSYLTALADVEASIPQVKTLEVTRVASSFYTTPANYTKKLEYGVIKEKGNGAKNDKYTVIAFDDGTFGFKYVPRLYRILKANFVKAGKQGGDFLALCHILKQNTGRLA